MQNNHGYEYYHQNPINKLLHFICIPIIIGCIVAWTSNIMIFSIKLKKIDLNLRITMFRILQAVYLNVHWNRYGFLTATMMWIYFEILEALVRRIKKRYIYWKRYSVMLFVLAWIVQFAGHYIEGRRPALIDGFMGTIIEAPLFSISYFNYIWKS